MIYKCPNCAAALIFEPKDNRLICHSCDSSFRPEDIDIKYFSTLHMELNIYSCTSCAAEIMVNETEAATYCIYCGQPVIVFDRVSSELKPDYIIPFNITKQTAQASLQYKIRKKFFVPKEFKNFKLDILRGIYVPFWLYDIDYSDKQYFYVTKKIAGGVSKSNRGYIKEVQTNFKNLPINASYALDDDQLQLLGKYELGKMVPFNHGYLSGFYADRYDIDYNQAAQQALQKAENIFDFEMERTISQKGYEYVIRKYKNPKTDIKQIKYVFLPVWFMTFRYEGVPYTLLVNGQTGTVAGNLPIKKSRALLLFVLCSIIIAPVFLILAYSIYLAYTSNQLHSWHYLLFAFTYFFFIITGLVLGHNGTKSIKRGLNFSRSFVVKKYVKERQDI